MKITCTLDEYTVFQDSGNVGKIDELEKILKDMGVADLTFHVEPSSKPSAPTDLEKWIRDSIGKTFDGDGVHGAQCKDYANAYAQWLGHPLQPSDAAATWDTTQEPYWQKIPYETGAKPQTGDIVIWAPWDENQYGHIAVVLEAKTDSFSSVDQNWVSEDSAQGSPAAFVDHSYTTPQVLGFLRPTLS